MEYLSPEYVQGRQSGFERDIWALGIIAYELLAGKNPLESLSENEKWSKMLKVTFKPLRLPNSRPNSFLPAFLAKWNNFYTKPCASASIANLPAISKKCPSSPAERGSGISWQKTSSGEYTKYWAEIQWITCELLVISFDTFGFGCWQDGRLVVLPTY